MRLFLFYSINKSILNTHDNYQYNCKKQIFHHGIQHQVFVESDNTDLREGHNDKSLSSDCDQSCTYPCSPAAIYEDAVASIAEPANAPIVRIITGVM